MKCLSALVSRAAGFAVVSLALTACGAATGIGDPNLVDGSTPTLDARADATRPDGIGPSPDNVVPPPLDGQVGNCVGIGDCPLGEVCVGSHGCDTPGVCVPFPTGCDDPLTVPACGCDGETYPSDCFAEMAGVRVAYAGICTTPTDGGPPDAGPGRCFASEDCDVGSYCEAPGCGLAGQCARRPDACSPAVGPSVCSCDGQSFVNECFARLAGQTPASIGACDEVDVIVPPVDSGPGAPCTDNVQCPPSDFCDRPTCGGVGACLPRVQPCTPGLVCGCDGVTYGSVCLASARGVSVAGNGPCSDPPPVDVVVPPTDATVGSCSSNRDCDPAQFCQGFSCGGSGTCVTRAIPCGGPPVCGCDGVTYGQACAAARSGERIASIGECTTNGGDGGPRDVPLVDAVTPPDATSAGCFSNAQCGPSQFCYAAGCGTVGRCVPRPGACPPIMAPVCACNGMTYSSFCEAVRDGQRVEGAGVCGILFDDAGAFDAGIRPDV